MKKCSAIFLSSLLLLVCLMTGCGGGEEVAVVDYFAPGDFIVVNILNSYRLLKVSPVLVLNKALSDPGSDGKTPLEDELGKAQPLIRDVFNTILRSKDENTLKAPGALDALRSEMTQALQEKLGMNYVTDIYFSDFVVQ